MYNYAELYRNALADYFQTKHPIHARLVAISDILRDASHGLINGIGVWQSGIYVQFGHRNKQLAQIARITCEDWPLELARPGAINLTVTSLDEFERWLIGQICDPAFIAELQMERCWPSSLYGVYPDGHGFMSHPGWGQEHEPGSKPNTAYGIGVPTNPSFGGFGEYEPPPAQNVSFRLFAIGTDSGQMLHIRNSKDWAAAQQVMGTGWQDSYFRVMGSFAPYVFTTREACPVGRTLSSERLADFVASLGNNGVL